MDEQLRDFTSRLLRNDMDATKHTCLYYLAGIIGTGAELEDFFYLMCKTLDYDKNKVLFYYSTYMTVTAGTLFSDSIAVLSDDNYEEWIKSRKQRCSSVRTSTCENLCRRKVYRDYDIPSHACSLCKLSPQYRNSRDPLERMVIRFFMDSSTPPASIYVNGSEDGFVSVERISPRANSFGCYPVIRFYNYVYDFLFNDTLAASLRSDRIRFNDAAASYISSRLDLSSYNSAFVSRDMVYNRLVVLLGLLWNTDIAPMKSDDDGNRFADACIMLMHHAYEPIYEGKQMNPRPVANGGVIGTKKGRRSKKRSESCASRGMDLLQMAETAVAAQAETMTNSDDFRTTETTNVQEVMIAGNFVAESISEQSESGSSDTGQQVVVDSKNSTGSFRGNGGEFSGLTGLQLYENERGAPAVVEETDFVSGEQDVLLPAILDCADFQDADYVPFNYGRRDANIGMDANGLQPESPEQTGDEDECIAPVIDDISGTNAVADFPCACDMTIGTGQTKDACLLPLQFAPTSCYPYVYGQLCVDEIHSSDEHGYFPSLPSEINYLGDLVQGVSAAYRYCACVPVLSAMRVSFGAPLRITDDVMLDFLHECATSEYAILLPAVSGMNEEGLLVFLSSCMRYHFFSLSVRGADNLDGILIDSHTMIYTSDTLGCMSMLVKYGSRMASGSLVGMDLVFQQARNIGGRNAVYKLDLFKGAGVLMLPLCMYEVYMDEFGGRGATARCHYEASRLMRAYHMLFHQRFLPPLLSDGAPLFAFDDDLHVHFLFSNGYRFTKRGTLYTIRFGPDVTVGGDLTVDSFLCDLLGLFDLMTHRHFHTSRIVYCDQFSVSVFLESTGSDAGIFYDMFYHGLETVLLDHGYGVAQTVTTRTEYS